MQQHVIEVIWDKTDSLGVWAKTQRNRGNITNPGRESRDKDRGQNGFYKLLLHPSPLLTLEP